MSDTNEIASAEARAAAAKQRLSSTLGELQTRLEPGKVLRDAVDGITETGKRHPGKIVGAVALAAAFLGRHRIGAMFRRKPDDDAQPPVTRRVRTATTGSRPAKRID